MTTKNLKKKYMIGFYADGQTAYGKEYQGNRDWADPMTITQARKAVKELHKHSRQKRVVYELVPIETID